MNALIVRFVGCAASLAVTGLLFPGSCSLHGVLFGGLLLTLLYTFLRPLLQLLVSPFNLFVFGLLTPLTDALLILWAAAWVKNLSLHYWEAVLTALLISLAYYPYSVWKKRKLAEMPVA